MGDVPEARQGASPTPSLATLWDMTRKLEAKSCTSVNRYVPLYAQRLVWNNARMGLSERELTELRAVLRSDQYDGSISSRAQIVLCEMRGAGKVISRGRWGRRDRRWISGSRDTKSMAWKVW